MVLSIIYRNIPIVDLVQGMSKERRRVIKELMSWTRCANHMISFITRIMIRKRRNISDAALAHRANEIANDPRFDDEQRRFANIVKIIMENKVRFRLGIQSKNFKRS